MNDDQENVTQEEGVGFIMPEGHTGMKFVVLFLGLGIVAMLVLIIGKIFKDGGEHLEDGAAVAGSTTEIASSVAPLAVTSIDGSDIELTAPAGASLQSSELSGSTLVLTFNLTGGGHAIALVDLSENGGIRWVTVKP